MEERTDRVSGKDEASQPSTLPPFQPSNLPALTILDAYIPVTMTLPAGNLLFIAPPRSSELFTVTGTVEQPVPRAATVAVGGGEATDPLLAHVNLAGVGVLEAARIPLPSWARPVIVGDSAGGTADLLFAGETAGRRVAVLAFDLHRSDLPLQVAFPLLLANLTAWLAPGGGSDLPTQVVPGAAVSFSLPPDAESIQVTRPGGSTSRLSAEGGRAIYADTQQLGVYGVRWGTDAGTAFAVNLFSPPESDVQPAPDLPLAGIEGTGAGAVDARQQARREWWRPIAWLALALLTAEWFIYQRPVLAQIVARVRRSMRRG